MKFFTILVSALFVLGVTVDAKTFSGGSGLQNDPYLIGTARQMDSVRYFPASYFKLITDLDLTIDYPNWTPVSSGKDVFFTGVFDGNNHVVKYKITSIMGMYVGLFGVNNGGTIKNLGVIAEITTYNDVVGGLVGFNRGVISSCFVTGNVKGSSNVGGIVGRNDKTISACYSSVNVTGGMALGGLIGLNNDAIRVSNCYSTGAVVSTENSPYNIGGFVGYNYSYSYKSTIMNCYSTGLVKAVRYNPGGFAGTNGYIANDSATTISNCYFNPFTSHLTKAIGDSAGKYFNNVYGKSTSDLQKAATFNNFDFTGTWGIEGGKTYPVLKGVSNNVPFAFPDTFKSHGEVDLSNLLANDYDFETAQTKLVYRLKKENSKGAIDTKGKYTFPTSAEMNFKDTMSYQIGEPVVLAYGKDTLWGNSASIILIKSNKAPVITSVAPTTAKTGVQYTYTITATDGDGDNLKYSLANAPAGMALVNNVITWSPASGVTTSGVITIEVSDGDLHASQQFTIAVTNSTQVNYKKEVAFIMAPNPVFDVLTVKGTNLINKLTVYDVNGAKLWENKCSSNEVELDMEWLNAGVYFVEVNTKSGIERHKVVKK